MAWAEKNGNLIIFFFHNSRSFHRRNVRRERKRQKSVYSLLNLNINFHLCNRLLHDESGACCAKEAKTSGQMVEKGNLQEERWYNKEKLCCTRLSREIHWFSAMPQLIKHRNKLEKGAWSNSSDVYEIGRNYSDVSWSWARRELVAMWWHSWDCDHGYQLSLVLHACESFRSSSITFLLLVLPSKVAQQPPINLSTLTSLAPDHIFKAIKLVLKISIRMDYHAILLFLPTFLTEWKTASSESIPEGWRWLGLSGWKVESLFTAFKSTEYEVGCDKKLHSSDVDGKPKIKFCKCNGEVLSSCLHFS